jgi:hypothetical protein
MPGGAPNGLMWVGTGDRSIETKVNFGKCFSTLPTVSVATKWIDCGNGNAAVLVVNYKNVDPCGFTIAYSTWSNSKIAQSVSSWIAFETFSTQNNLLSSDYS